MVDRIGNGNGLAHQAIQAALKAHAEKAAELRSGAAALGGPAPVQVAPSENTAESFASQLAEGLQSVDGKVKEAEGIAEDLITGKIRDFHEVAVQIRQADLSFRFALEIRNKLVDAYREVMRMNV